MLLKNNFNTGAFLEDFQIEHLEITAAHHKSILLYSLSEVAIIAKHNWNILFHNWNQENYTTVSKHYL